MKPYSRFFNVFCAVIVFFFTSQCYAIDFFLVNASTGETIEQMETDNYIIDLQQVGTALNIRAEVNENVAQDKVRFLLDGAVVRTEKNAPYTLAGDDGGGHYNAWTPDTGTHTLEAVALDQNDNTLAQGTITFSVSNESVHDIVLMLVNADEDTDLYELNDTDTIDFSTNGALNIRADVRVADHAGVQFEIDGKVVGTERAQPYALAGDDGNGDYFAWTPPPAAGSHTLRVVALRADGPPVAQRTINFTVPGNNENDRFDKDRGDLISLHYDHSPDPDDGHSAVADKTITDYYGISSQVHVVSGTYSRSSRALEEETFGAETYQDKSEDVMRATWGNAWLNAAGDDYNGAVNPTAVKWRDVLKAGGHVWIKEGGPSDFTSEVIRELHGTYSIPTATTKTQIHLVQHGPDWEPDSKEKAWNEYFTDEENLDFVNDNTEYIKIADGNHAGNGTARLVINHDDKDWNVDATDFVKLAEAHETCGDAWAAAFDYYNPFDGEQYAEYKWHALDFSDTVELLKILGIDVDTVNDCNSFADVFLK